MLRRTPLLLTLLLLAACGDDDRMSVDLGPRPDIGPTEDGGATDGGEETDAEMPVDAGPEACPRTLAEADRERFVVVGHPQARSYEVLSLATDGTLTETGNTFTMGRSAEAPIVFTPDGQVGVAAQQDGTLGVFTLAEDGTPTVVHANYDGVFRANRVVMDPSGESAWILDSQWRETGGGLYRVYFGCDGSIVREEKVTESRLPYALGFEESGNAIVVAANVLNSRAGEDIHRVDLEGLEVLAGANPFTHSDWIVSGFAIGTAEQHAFMGDTNDFGEVPNSVAVIGLGDEETVLSSLQTVEVDDPTTILVSPFDDAVLVVSTNGNAIVQYDYFTASPTPLTEVGELTYAERAPALPTIGDTVTRGTLAGLALIAENVAVRVVLFENEGVVTDLGPLELGTGNDAITNALGIQP